MARPVRNGLLYFPIDVDFFTDKKIKALKARYGGDGIAFYLYLLTEIYRNGYYITWDMDSEDSAIADLNISEGFLKQVLTFLVGRSLLTSITTNSDTIITSPKIQKTYQEAIKGLRRDIEVDPEIWLLKEEDTAPFIKNTQKQGLYSKNHSKYGNNGNENGVYDINKIKENKRKEKEIKKFPPDCFAVIAAKRLREGIVDILPHQRVPSDENIDNWAKHIDFMQRLDGRSEQDILALIDFALNDDFWCTNIRSTAKLREKQDTLYAQMMKKQGKAKPVQKPVSRDVYNDIDRRRAELGL